MSSACGPGGVTVSSSIVLSHPGWDRSQEQMKAAYKLDQSAEMEGGGGVKGRTAATGETARKRLSALKLRLSSLKDRLSLRFCRHNMDYPPKR